MFIVEKIVTLLQERWKYLLGYYMLGYLISLMQSGVPNLYYLIPLKPYAIIFGLGVGNGLYKSSEERKKRKVAILPIYISLYHGVKYVIPAMIFTAIFYVILYFAGFVFKVDISPLTAPF
jgi:hypothetical protein